MEKRHASNITYLIARDLMSRNLDLPSCMYEEIEEFLMNDKLDEVFKWLKEYITTGRRVRPIGDDE